MLLTAGDCHLERQTICVHHCVDFGRPPSTGTSKSFAGTIFGAARVLMSADYRTVNHLNIGIVPMRDGSQDVIPNACATPANEPVVTGRIWAVAIGQIIRHSAPVRAYRKFRAAFLELESRPQLQIQCLLRFLMPLFGPLTGPTALSPLCSVSAQRPKAARAAALRR